MLKALEIIHERNEPCRCWVHCAFVGFMVVRMTAVAKQVQVFHWFVEQ